MLPQCKFCGGQAFSLHLSFPWAGTRTAPGSSRAGHHLRGAAGRSSPAGKLPDWVCPVVLRNPAGCLPSLFHRAPQISACCGWAPVAEARPGMSSQEVWNVQEVSSLTYYFFWGGWWLLCFLGICPAAGGRGSRWSGRRRRGHGAGTKTPVESG